METLGGRSEDAKQPARNFPNLPCPMICSIQLHMLTANANQIRSKTWNEINTASKSWRLALIGSIRESRSQACVLGCFEVTEPPPAYSFLLLSVTDTAVDLTPNCHRSRRDLVWMPSQLLLQDHATQVNTRPPIVPVVVALSLCGPKRTL